MARIKEDNQGSEDYKDDNFYRNNQIHDRNLMITNDTPIIVCHETLNRSNKYAGLANQGSTCYLNSLLQSLFMTPDFRLNLFNWKFDPQTHGNKSECIPYQLKKLFTQLQLKAQNFEETSDLTKSFGWDSGQVFQQHDIQELCRVLFDAIEISLGPNDHNFIYDLYLGNMNQVIKCSECENISSREDKFLDITLPIQNIFENIHNKSLEMALRNILKPETLENDNQYFCEKCNQKVNAFKYTKFGKLPKILFFQLGRFEYDFTTDTRKKINDKIVFPILLNFNKYIQEYNLISYDPNQCENEDFSLSYSEEMLKGYLSEGPLVYELFSIVVHSGSALGGHYYAYIKSFEDGKWYNFNDSNVYEISTNDIKAIFGGADTTGYSGNTGYCLMYRIVGTEGAHITIDQLVISEEIKKEIEEQNQTKIGEEQIRKEKYNDMILKVYYYDLRKEIPIKRTDNVKELKARSLKEFELENKINPEDVKIRAYHSQHSKKAEYFEKEEYTLDEAFITEYRDYILEIRDPVTKQFEEYDPLVCKLFIYPWSDENWTKTDDQLHFDELKIKRNASLGTLKKMICEMYNFHELTPLYICRRIDLGSNNNNFARILHNYPEMNKELYTNNIYEGTKIMVEVALSPAESKFLKLFNDHLSTVKISFNLPLEFSRIHKESVTFGDYKFDNDFQVKKSDTLKKVKDTICEMIGVAPEDIKLSKYSHNGEELRALGDTVLSITKGISTSLTIYVENGKCLQEDELTVSIVYCDYDYSVFKAFPYRLTELGEMVINEKITIRELKGLFAGEVKRRMGIDIDLDYALLREHIVSRPGKIYNDERCVKSLNFNIGKRLIIQEYKYEKLVVDTSDVQITLRFFDVENFFITDPIEIHFPSTLTLLEIANLINLYYPKILPENMSVHKIQNGYGIYLDDILAYDFYRLYEHSTARVDEYPLFIKSEGNLLVLRDTSQAYQDPSEAARIFYCKPQINYECTALVIAPTDETEIKPVEDIIIQTDPKKDVRSKKNRVFKEKGIVIKVKKNQHKNENIDNSLQEKGQLGETTSEEKDIQMGETSNPDPKNDDEDIGMDDTGEIEVKPITKNK